MQLYVIRDMLLQESAPVWEQKNESTAIRAYHVAMRDCPNPQDYRLYRIGEYNHETDTGEIYARPLEVMTHIDIAEARRQEVLE